MTNNQVVIVTRQVLIDAIRRAIPESPVQSLAFALRICNLSVAQETGLIRTFEERVLDATYGGYPEVASIGFQIAKGDGKSNELTSKFLDGLQRQTERSASALEALSLDDVALLGLADGIAVIQRINQSVEIENLKQWVLDLINLEPKRKIWTSRLRDLAGDLLDKKGRLRSLPDWSDLNSASLEIVLRDLWQEQQMHHDVLPFEFFTDLLSRLIRHANPETTQVEELIVWLKAIDLLIEQNSKALFPKADIALSILNNIKDQLDRVAAKNTKISMLAGVVVFIIINIGYFYAKLNLVQGVQDIFNYFVPLLSGILVYIYYAVSQKEISPKEIYNQILEKHKIRLYKKWGFDIDKFRTIQSKM